MIPDFDENRVWTVIVGVCQGKDNDAIYNNSPTNWPN